MSAAPDNKAPNDSERLRIVSSIRFGYQPKHHPGIFATGSFSAGHSSRIMDFAVAVHHRESGLEEWRAKQSWHCCGAVAMGRRATNGVGRVPDIGSDLSRL